MESASLSVYKRLKTELDYITENEGAEVYMAAQGLVKLAREFGYYSTSRMHIGSSLIAYLLDITEVDPLRHNLSFEVFAGLDFDRQPDIHLSFDAEFIPHAQRYMRDNFPDVYIMPEDSDLPPDCNAAIYFTVCQAYAKIKKLADMTGADISGIPFDDGKTLDMLMVADTSNVPTFDSDFARDMIKGTEPKTFDDFVKIYGLSKGIYVWSRLDDDGVNLVSSEMPAYSDIIVFREDIAAYLLDKGIDRAAAYEIMEKVRKGRGLTVGHEEIMTNAGVPKCYIESCKNVKYLFPKGQAVSDTMLAFRIAWFKAHYPEEFL